MNFKNYKETIEELNNRIDNLKINEEEKKQLLNLVDETEDKFKRFDNYIDLNFEVYEKEKEILLQHFIEKDKELNQVYVELNGYKSTIFYKVFVLARKIYRSIFKRNHE